MKFAENNGVHEYNQIKLHWIEEGEEKEEEEKEEEEKEEGEKEEEEEKVPHMCESITG